MAYLFHRSRQPLYISVPGSSRVALSSSGAAALIPRGNLVGSRSISTRIGRPRYRGCHEAHRKRRIWWLSRALQNGVNSFAWKGKTSFGLYPTPSPSITEFTAAVTEIYHQEQDAESDQRIGYIGPATFKRREESRKGFLNCLISSHPSPTTKRRRIPIYVVRASLHPSSHSYKAAARRIAPSARAREPP